MHAYMLCGAVGRLSGCMNSFVVQILLEHKQREEPKRSAGTGRLEGRDLLAPAGN